MVSNQERARKAMNVLKALGFGKKMVTPILKNLLDLYNNNWELIEDENYQALVDAVLENLENNPQENATTELGSEKNKEVIDFVLEESPLKRRKLDLEQSRDVPTSSSKRLCRAKSMGPSNCLLIENNAMDDMQPESPGRLSMLAQLPNEKLALKDISWKEPKVEHEVDLFSLRTAPVNLSAEAHHSGFSPAEEAPLAICRPAVSAENTTVNKETQDDRRFCEQTVPWKSLKTLLPQHNGMDEGSCSVILADKRCEDHALDTKGTPTHINLASSAMGEVKILLACHSESSNFRVPSLQDVFKMVEDRCLHSYKILPTNFSLGNLMNEICDCVVQLAQGPAAASNQETNAVEDTSTKNSNEENGSAEGTPLLGDMPSGTLIISTNHLPLDTLRPTHNPSDISKGEERMRISIVNEFSNGKFPCSFSYVPRNVVYQNAYLNFSLARIGDENCCPDCYLDCLSAPVPCTCACETGGEFAYTQDGLLKKEFLDECVARKLDPGKQQHVFCKECPLEKVKNRGASVSACKGHLVKKFVKECFTKCGCSKHCGNRVVQRGVTSNLQVVFTSEGKGWGVRTLEELPRGAFVFEYVGEVLTAMELQERMGKQTGDNLKQTLPMILDANWSSEATLRDEEALCLDSTFYGNISRFLNHRCFDANLIEIPVEVETPDHHYYHIAFFTSRKIEAFEELTWDYGIDFDDYDSLVKLFQCHCGSRYCRGDSKRKSARRKNSAAQ